MSEQSEAVPSVDVDVEMDLEDKGFEQAPNGLLMPEGDEPNVSDAAVRCYMVLRHLGATQGFRIRVSRVAERMDRSERSVRGYMAELEAAGWLLRTPMYAQSDRRGQRPGRITVMWKRATPERIAQHQKKVDAILAEHKAETESRKTSTPAKKARRRPAPKPVDTVQDLAGHGVQDLAGLAMQDLAGHGVQDLAGHDPSFPQVRGPVSEGYSDLLTQTSSTQTAKNHTRAERGVQASSPSVTRESGSDRRDISVDGARSARHDGPGRAAFEAEARRHKINIKVRGEK